MRHVVAEDVSEFIRWLADVLHQEGRMLVSWSKHDLNNLDEMCAAPLLPKLCEYSSGLTKAGASAVRWRSQRGLTLPGTGETNSHSAYYCSD